MSVINAARGFLADLIDRLADRVARAEPSQTAMRETANTHLMDDSRNGGRDLIARMARSEVKNYLAELAEGAQLPFRGPGEFLKDISSFLTMTPAEFQGLLAAREKNAANWNHPRHHEDPLHDGQGYIDEVEYLESDDHKL